MAASFTDTAPLDDAYGPDPVTPIPDGAADASLPDAVAPAAAQTASGQDAPARITAFEGDNQVADMKTDPADAPFVASTSLSAFLAGLDVAALDAAPADNGFTAVSLGDAPHDPWAGLYIPETLAAFAAAYVLSLDGMDAVVPADDAIVAESLVDGPKDAAIELRIAESIGDFAVAHVFGDAPAADDDAPADVLDMVGLVGAAGTYAADFDLGA